MFYLIYLAYYECEPLRKNTIKSSWIIKKKHEKSSKIKNNLNYLGVFIDILLVLGKNPRSLAAW